MRLRVRAVAVATVGALAVAMLAGCGADGSGGSSSGAASPAAAATPACPAVRAPGALGYFSASSSNIEQIVDTATGRLVGRIEGLSQPSNTYVTPDGRKVYIDNWGGRDIVVVDACTRRIARTIEVGGRVLGSLDPSGTYLYETFLPSGTVEAGPGKVLRIDTRTDRVVATCPTPQKPVASVVSPDGRKVYVATLGTVMTLDAATGHVLGEPVRIGAIPGWLALSPDGRRLYTANLPTGVSVLDTATNRLVVNIPTPPGSAPQYNAVAPDGKTQWEVYAGGGVGVFSTATNELIQTLPTEGMGMTVSFSPDGTRAFVGEGGPNTVRADGFRAVIDSATGSWHPGPGNLTIYDVATRRLITRIRGVGEFPGVVGIAARRTPARG
ncbi:exported hypothetical protein [Frankia canadensis]|uniref:YVTN family beta-propeller repeat protein n=1 Tax=Frankia canadensis TaxID=1836972 RepID=A0A2I2KV37_9ACTN|nr:hypothetical protein [Frankia canadensis]SNQ49543.1 exported hypothetical protein [Frankia canadensis]SOU56833.1 exported hypothetical protein [Frankia canadensis]